MLQLLLSLLLVSLCFQSALAGEEKLALHSQQLYRSVQESQGKCRVDGRFYIRYGEEHFEGWRRFHKLSTANTFMDDNYISCLSDVMCEHTSPRDVNQARKIYTDARRTCSEASKGESASEIRLNEEANPTIESGGLQSLDSGSILATSTSVKTVTFTVENLIYLLAGALIGAVGR